MQPVQPEQPELSDQPQQSPSSILLPTILDTIGREIVSGELPEGHTFTLHHLSERFDVSRTVARETMRALEQLGMVSSSRRVGLRVLPQSEWNVFDEAVIEWRLQSETQRPAQLASLRELRDAIEPVASRHAAEHASAEEVAQLRELATRIVELAQADAGNSQEFLEADIKFHSVLLAASGNEMFCQLTEPTMEVLRARTYYGIMPDDPAVETMRIHVDIVDAIERGDADAAEHASRSLLRGVNNFMEI